MEEKFSVDHKKKINQCLNCEKCDLNFTLTETGEFWYSIRCKEFCPNKLNFECMQCLMCSNFELCFKDFKTKH